MSPQFIVIFLFREPVNFVTFLNNYATGGSCRNKIFVDILKRYIYGNVCFYRHNCNNNV